MLLLQALVAFADLAALVLWMIFAALITSIHSVSIHSVSIEYDSLSYIKLVEYSEST